ncbi:hypothetical protein ACFJIY_24510 [Pimelobacter simplex]|uniref:DUF7341 domain-containing protein n=1 Tax=Nocardioides simplex TaxID=2045 RepID=UPI003672F4AE
MTDPHRQGMTTFDYVRDLVDAHTNIELYTVRDRGQWLSRRHATTAPALLDQLWANDIPSGTVEEGPRAGYSSKPAARLDALDTAARIDLEVCRWITDLGETPPLDTKAALRLLHGLSVTAEEPARREIQLDIRRWWIRARIVTGWDSPAGTPDNTCSQRCERGTLRIRLADHVAACVEDVCRATWDEATIGLLADHIRAESEAERQPTAGPGPCSCPVPKPVVPDLSRLCPRCGSARCRHALGARLLDTIRADRAGTA